MAGPDTIVSRVGQINKAGAHDAMFLKQFGVEILTEFLRKTAFRDRHFIHQIQNGKSASFPLIGTSLCIRRKSISVNGLIAHFPVRAGAWKD